MFEFLQIQLADGAKAKPSPVMRAGAEGETDTASLSRESLGKKGVSNDFQTVFRAHEARGTQGAAGVALPGKTDGDQASPGADQAAMPDSDMPDSDVPEEGADPSLDDGISDEGDGFDLAQGGRDGQREAGADPDAGEDGAAGPAAASLPQGLAMQATDKATGSKATGSEKRAHAGKPLQGAPVGMEAVGTGAKPGQRGHAAPPMRDDKGTAKGAANNPAPSQQASQKIETSMATSAIGRQAEPGSTHVTHPNPASETVAQGQEGGRAASFLPGMAPGMADRGAGDPPRIGGTGANSRDGRPALPPTPMAGSHGAQPGNRPDAALAKIAAQRALPETGPAPTASTEVGRNMPGSDKAGVTPAPLAAGPQTTAPTVNVSPHIAAAPPSSLSDGLTRATRTGPVRTLPDQAYLATKDALSGLAATGQASSRSAAAHGAPLADLAATSGPGGGGAQSRSGAYAGGQPRIMPEITGAYHPAEPSRPQDIPKPVGQGAAPLAPGLAANPTANPTGAMTPPVLSASRETEDPRAPASHRFEGETPPNRALDRPATTGQTQGAGAAPNALAATMAGTMVGAKGSVSQADEVRQTSDPLASAAQASELRGSADTPGAARASTPQGLPYMPDTARHVINQVAAAIQRNGDRSIEITLSPAELGRLRINLSPGEAGLVVAITAERGETLDLLRRNADMLAQEFRMIGQDGASFSFASGGGQGGRAPLGEDRAPPDAGLPAEPVTTATDAMMPPPRLSPTQRMDIRI